MQKRIYFHYVRRHTPLVTYGIFHQHWHRVAAFVVFGSGLLNILTAAGHAVAEQHEFIFALFPIEIVRASTLTTLLLGIGLCIVGFNLYRRKHRAFQFALVFSLAAACFDIARGPDYAEAGFSLGTAALLIASRRSYTVQSGPPDYRRVLRTMVFAFFLLFTYGTAGFLFLDMRGFGVEFSLGESLLHAFRQVFLMADPALIPHTRYARYFLDSMHIAMALVAAFFASALFVPVAYQAIAGRARDARARQLCRRYGSSSLDYFKVWPDKSYYFAPGDAAFLAYGVSGGTAIVLGDPVGTDAGIAAAIDGFSQFASRNGWRVAFYQVEQRHLPQYAQHGFQTFKIGDEAVVTLADFIAGPAGSKKVRNVLTKFEREGYTAALLPAPITQDIYAQLARVSSRWLSVRGRREHTFVAGRFSRRYITGCRVFVVRDRDRAIVAFANVLPPYLPGAVAIDLMRFSTEAPNGTMDFLFTSLMTALAKEGAVRFSLGLAPLSGFATSETPTTAERTIHGLAENVGFLFSFKGLRAYKAKYAPVWEPRYLAYRTATDVPFIVHALRTLSDVGDNAEA